MNAPAEARPLLNWLAVFALAMGLAQAPALLLSWQRRDVIGALGLSLPVWALALPATMTALFWLISAVGLWGRWPWARLWALWGLPTLLTARFAWIGAMAQNPASLATMPGRIALGAALCLVWAFILTRPRIRAAFHASREGKSE